MPEKQNISSLVISYLSLRKAVGVIGISLPFVLVFGKIILESPGILDSVSSYYYSVMRDVFVGSLCAIGVFLFSYHGYEREDDIAAKIASISAIGVALFPIAPETAATAQQVMIGKWHLFFALILFLTLAYFALVLFRKTDPHQSPTPMKRVRNVIYAVCGSLILFCIAAIIFLTFVPPVQWIPIIPHSIFWLEALAIISFGISWLIKGEAILQDQGSS